MYMRPEAMVRFGAVLWLPIYSAANGEAYIPYNTTSQTSGGIIDLRPGPVFTGAWHLGVLPSGIQVFAARSSARGLELWSTPDEFIDEPSFVTDINPGCGDGIVPSNTGIEAVHFKGHIIFEARTNSSVDSGDVWFV